MICKLFKKPAKPELPLNVVNIGPGMVPVALAEVGNGERGANNAGLHVEKYAAALNRRAPMLWCSAFVYYCYLTTCDILKVKPLVSHRRSSSAKGLRKEVLTAGGRDVPFTEAQPGDLAIWHRGVKNTWRGHVGIVLSTKPGESTFTTLEGNKGTFPANVGVFKHAVGEPMFMTFVRFPAHPRSI